MNIWTSDPGTTAELTPFCETHGLYFSDEYEPEGMQYTLDRDIINTLECDDEMYMITPGLQNPDSYYNMLTEASEMSKGIKRVEESKDDSMYVIDIELEDEI